MRVVHVLTRFLRAGTEENTAITCNGQVAAGHEVWLVHGKEHQADVLQLLDPQVRTIRLENLVHPVRLGKDLKAVLELRRLFQTIRADVVHTHQSKAGALGRLAAQLAGTPHIVHGVHILPFINVSLKERLVYLLVERLLANCTQAFIHVTPALRDACLAAGVGRRGQHFVVPSGMDVSRFRNAAPPEDAGALLEPLSGRTDRPLTVLLISALERRKRHAEFLEVFRRVVHRNPNVRLLLAGEGGERAAIEAQIKRLGLSDHVRLLGLRNDVESLIALADVGVLASEREGLARAVIQYALGGRPIVAPKLPGIGAVVRHGENGFLVGVADLDAMEDHLVSLLQEEMMRKRMGRMSTETDLSDWAAERMVEQIGAVYATIGAVDASASRIGPLAAERRRA